MTGRFLFWRKPTATNRIGVMHHAGVLYLVVLQPDGYCAFFTREIATYPSWQACFISFIRESELYDAEVYVVLCPDEYQQVSVERPAVDDTEMHQSLVWAIKDFTSEPASSMSIDYYDVVSGNRNNQRVQVVCTSGQRIRDWAQCCHGIATLKAVTIDELAIADIFGESTQVNVLLYQHSNQELHLLAVWNGQVCFSRSLRGYASVFSEHFDVWQQHLTEQFVLDIQRSCDYLVGQLKLPQVSNLHLAFNVPSVVQISEYLDEQFPFKVSVFQDKTIPEDKRFLPVWGVLQGLNA